MKMLKILICVAALLVVTVELSSEQSVKNCIVSHISVYQSMVMLKYSIWRRWSRNIQGIFFLEANENLQLLSK